MAAVEVFIEQGVQAPLEAVAHRADLGIATLYRHFPDRRTLVEATAVHAFGTVRDLARDTVGSGAGPDSLWRFLSGIVELRLGVLMASLLPLLTEQPPSEEVTEAFDALVAAIESVVEHAHATGQLRADVGTDDLMLLLAVLTQPLHGAPHDFTAATTPRLLHLVVEGLAPTGEQTRPPAAPPRPAWGEAIPDLSERG